MQLAARTGAILYLSAEGGREWQYQYQDKYAHQLVRDGDTFYVGNLRFEVRHTPGHTPEHITLLVTDTKGADRPIMTQDDRCELLAALRVVDRVFLISGERVDPDYYVEVLRPLAPRYLAVTADDPFLAEKREAMARIGVEVRVVTPRIENYSTTRLIRLLGLT